MTLPRMAARAVLSNPLALVAALLALQPAPAFAGSILDILFDPFRPFLAEILGLLAAALAGWLVKRIRDWTGIEIEARHREALQSALENAARLALRRAAGREGEIGRAAFDAGVDYVLRSVPDAVRHFGLTPGRVAELIRPRMLPPAG